MYKVIQLYGTDEPWWFFDGWEKDIRFSKEFASIDEALQEYEERWISLKESTDDVNSKKNCLAAFWKKQDEKWCDECGDYVQYYHGLMLLRNNEELSQEEGEEIFATLTKECKTKVCPVNGKNLQ